MESLDKNLVIESMEGFRRKEIEPVWEALDRPDAEAMKRLQAALEQAGWGRLGLPEPMGGMEVDPESLYEAISTIAAGSPSLAMAAITHWTALERLLESKPMEAWNDSVREALGHAWFALGDSLLNAETEPEIQIQTEGDRLRLNGETRIANPHTGWIALAALDAEGRKRLVALSLESEGVEFHPQTGSHGCSLLAFGKLQLNEVETDSSAVGDYPTKPNSPRRADGRVASAIAGMLGEMAQRGMAYALERWQGGKMIYQHDAIRQMFGDILVARDVVRASAIGALGDDASICIGSASANACRMAWPAGLDAIQSFGGYGYMEDFRVERYLRDANTIDTFWIGSERVRRQIAIDAFRSISGKREAS